MKVGYVVETPVSHNLTGGVRSFLGFIKQLKNNTDIEPFVLCSEEWEFTEELKKMGISYVTSKMYRPFATYPKPVRFFRLRHLIKQFFNHFAKRRGYRFFRKNQVELIHVNSQFAGLVGAEIANKLHVPYIYHIREVLKEGFGVRFFNEKYASKLIGKSAAIIAISDFIYDTVLKELPNSNIIKIYNGIELPEPISLDINLDSPINACVVGRVTPGKCQIDAIKAIEILKNKYGINLILHIVGWEGIDTYEKQIKEYIKENNLSDNVVLVPFTNDVLSVTKNCQIGFVCSEFEAFGRVTIESMSLGQIVFVSDSGANSELVKDGYNGFVYPLHNCDALAEIINDKLHLDKKTLTEISQHAVLDCKENYSISITAKNIYSAYKSVLNNKIIKE